MRKSAFLLTILILGLAAGCGVELPSPVPTDTPTTAPTSLPSPTSVPEATTAAPSGPASCTVSESAIATLALDNFPPTTAEDWGRGPENAPIVVTVYSDFQ